MSAYVPAGLKRLVRQRFENRCAYCRTAEYLTATHFEIEHIDPRAAGGQTVFANLCLACPMCNRFKSDSSLAVDPLTATKVPLFHPHLQLWREHFAWSQDGTQIVGLSPMGRATIAALRMNRPAIIRVRRMWPRWPSILRHFDALESWAQVHSGRQRVKRQKGQRFIVPHRIASHDVLLMPEGLDAQTLADRSRWLAQICQQKSYRLSPRLHITLFGNTRGT